MDRLDRPASFDSYRAVQVKPGAWPDTTRGCHMMCLNPVTSLIQSSETVSFSSNHRTTSTTPTPMASISTNSSTTVCTNCSTTSPTLQPRQVFDHLHDVGQHKRLNERSRVRMRSLRHVGTLHEDGAVTPIKMAGFAVTEVNICNKHAKKTASTTTGATARRSK
eukprot:m.256380 g.256380  ORF g.256380 m.256380 type:complete len:164 (-) comp26570_c0_seq15:5624-6115(-)